ncbi:MAG TPA: DegT/DnrJ/EryC1/StrS family aminotransferase [Candidatus Dormibacteraeota bacterium]|nr:DegT/DnrJ/EryC1/StrS family aminotransferase [Candidatus Dormibacteraeota bacterium]
MIPVARPWLGEAEADAARRPLLSGWVTQGPEVAAFEAEFAAAVGAPHACAVSNCTVALHLALRAAGVGRGDDVVTVSHSFIATANSIRYLGARPVFVDVQPGTFNMNPELVEEALTPRTRAILCVHQMGMPCDLAALAGIARRRGLPLVEDAACATGSEILWEGGWEHIGRPHGDVACFSFHPRKLVTAGDGGMLTTADEEWDRKFRLWRQHGMSVPDTVRHSLDRVVIEEYLELGYNYRMTDLQAAVARTQLARLPTMIQRRRLLADRYAELLSGIPGLGLPEEPAWARSNWQSFCVRLPSGCDQRQVMEAMLDAGVATRRGIMCAHREPAYSVEPWLTAPSGLIESEMAQDDCILLPLFHELAAEEQEAVAAALRQACAVTAVP